MHEAVQAELEAVAADLASLRQEVVGNVRLGMIGAQLAAGSVLPLLDRLALTHPREGGWSPRRLPRRRPACCSQAGASTVQW